MAYDRSTVEKAVQLYFDGLYEGDADKLGAVFQRLRPTCAGRRRASLKILTVPDWLAWVRKRPVGQGRRQGARGFHRFYRSFRRSNRLYQGALPVAAALLHRLPCRLQDERRLDHRVEVLPVRRQGIGLGDHSNGQQQSNRENRHESRRSDRRNPEARGRRDPHRLSGQPSHRVRGAPSTSGRSSCARSASACTWPTPCRA